MNYSKLKCIHNHNLKTQERERHQLMHLLTSGGSRKKSSGGDYPELNQNILV